jgi:hypothetical protein
LVREVDVPFPRLIVLQDLSGELEVRGVMAKNVEAQQFTHTALLASSSVTPFVISLARVLMLPSSRLSGSAAAHRSCHFPL